MSCLLEVFQFYVVSGVLNSRASKDCRLVAEALAQMIWNGSDAGKAVPPSEKLWEDFGIAWSPGQVFARPGAFTVFCRFPGRKSKPK